MAETDINSISFADLEEVTGLVHNIYGFDLSGYSKASLKRRVSRVMQLHKLSFFELKSLLINQRDFFDEFLLEITVNVTEMFRDPDFYRSLREKVLPYLRSFQRIKIWNAGCSTGEEVYSFAILLEEANLYERSFIYGTDLNARVIADAKKGIYDLKKMKQFSENYQDSGSVYSLSNYYTAKYDAASIRHALKKNVLFSVHNLISDGVFNEFQLISCRNVLIYFTSELQAQVMQLFYDSLCPFGFLCLGPKETLRDEKLTKRFKMIDKPGNIYQKIA